MNGNADQHQPSWAKSATLRLVKESEQVSGRISPRGPASGSKLAQQPQWAEGRDETLHQTDAHQQSGTFRRLNYALQQADGILNPILNSICQYRASKRYIY